MFTAFTDSGLDRQQVAQTSNQHLAWSLALVATKRAAQANPHQVHAATCYNHATGTYATIPYPASR